MYYLIGREPRLRKLPKQQIQNEREVQRTVSAILQEHSEVIHGKHDLSTEIFHLSGKYPTINNHLTVLNEGAEAFASLLEDIKKAKHHVHVFFISLKGMKQGRS